MGLLRVVGSVLAALSGLTYRLTIMGLRWVEQGKLTGVGSSGDGTATATPADGGLAIATVVCGNSIAFLVSLPGALPVVSVAALDWALVLYLGVIQIALAYALLTRGIRRLLALEVSLLLLNESPALHHPTRQSVRT